MKSFRNRNPAHLREAVQLLAQAGGESGSALVAGGGSDLLVLIKEGLAAPDLLVNLKSVRELKTVRSGEGGLHVGALLTLAQVSAHPLIRSRYPVLAEAAASVGTPQIRNVGTLGGNLCQRPWCWYFRQGFPCFKNGGDVCYSVVGENQYHAIFGGGPSFIVHPSDTAPALIALEARFRLVGPEGERVVAARDFFILPEQDVRRENVLQRGEILAEVILPPAQGEMRGTYAKIMDREAWTHAVVSAAVVLRMEGARCAAARVVLGGVAPIPWRVPAVEALLEGREITPELARRAGEEAVRGASPLARNGYKVALTSALIRRTLLSLSGQERESA